jgi:RNA polymerase sigma-70 factor, ECF subfamily
MTTTTELTDDGLLQRVVAGDEEAFTVLYRRKQPAIFRFALHMSGNAAVAEDVTQEVFMVLIRDAKRFDPARGTLGGFLFGVARNHLRKRWEQDRRLLPFTDDPERSGNTPVVNGARPSDNGNHHGSLASPHEDFASVETVSRVRRAISTLPESYREVVVLCELEGLSYEEIAAALDCPIGTVRSRLHRARAMLLEKLREAPPARSASAVSK